ncbi:hypothetical protein AB0N23_13430 [Streptomyces sp. NPDC052644]
MNAFDRIAAIQARNAAATKGPWCTDSWEIYQGSEYLPGISSWVGECCRSEDPEQALADAEFIAHARDDVPWLLAEVERLRARVAELEAERHSTNEALSEAAETLRANRDRIAALEQLRPARFQDCPVCGAGYEYGQPCSQCEFRKQMAAEVLAERSTPWVGAREDRYESPLHSDYATPHDLPARLMCPVAGCEHGEPFDPEHGTPDPETPASGDLAHDELVEHMVAEHGTTRSDASYALSHWRRVVTR